MNKILLGSNYYPEDWDENQIDEDIRKMVETGFNVTRVAEFAWRKMEPEEGKYDFKWLHNVVDKLKNAGIYVIMGTPTATPPAWLYKKYPEMGIRTPGGVREIHGGRRHCCSSNPHYLEYSLKIVEKLAQEFGNDENVIGWQIDNEIYPDKLCTCEHCIKNYHEWLKNRYGSVEEINKKWNLNLFSQAYDSIDDIPAPVNGWHNPHIKFEWQLTQGNNHMNFVHAQAEVIRKYSKKPIGTDTMPFNSLNYRTLNDKLDVAQFNHYTMPDHFPSILFWMDYMRKFSKLPFWNTETQATWSGATAPSMYVLEDNFVYMNSWMTYILGGSANLYWLWCTHWAGHELAHGAVTDSSGRYTHTHDELVQLSKELKKSEEFLLDTRVKSNVAITFQSLNWNIQLYQDVNTKLKKNQNDVYDYYSCILKEGTHPDVIDLYEDISEYKVIFSPYAFSLDEADFEQKITKWVEDGGCWVVGPLSDIRTSIGTKYIHAPYGFLEKLTGARQLYIMPDDNNTFTCENEKGEVVKCSSSYEIFESMGENNLITVKNGHKAVIGKPCAMEIPVKKGKVIILGTIPEEKELRRIISKAITENGGEKYDVAGGLTVVRREGENHNGLIVADVYGSGGTFRFEGTKKDILTDKVHNGFIKLEPYTLAILE